ncbi:complement C4-B isoform X1 [Hippoglossus hippoglossus]|uniref:complement C4-B isoform X1 n=1 Tax=Hippoglossus hippoglossus TaxID=8267 RepID=UPI00148D51A4|nr:complement C4-B isoform X1 [Hippoglossus hippoglossus]
MRCPAVSLLLLIVAVETGCSTGSRFFISAPNVFHVGVKEKVFVQMGEPYLDRPVTLYLEAESSGIILSEKKTVVCTHKHHFTTAELMIDSEVMSRFEKHPKYLLLVAESPAFSERKMTKVLVSKHRGYIFIQTNQPVYNPKQKVSYRIFTLDHTLRPHEATLLISVFNAAGNRIMRTSRKTKGGIFSDNLPIPDVSGTGTWKITAHYPEDEANAVSREFKVKKFVLPSFEVNVKMEQNCVLLKAEEFVFTISAMYSHGEMVKGAYHCKFGVSTKGGASGQKRNTVIIRGLELTGSVQDGTATVSLPIAKLNERLQKDLNLTLSDLQQRRAQVYLGIFVTNIKSGEMQETEVYLPVLSHKYTVDLSRTRSHFVPGYPLDVVVIVRLPDGSPAPDVPVRIDIPGTSELFMQGTTNQEGAVFLTFNINTAATITVEVTADDLHQRKTIQRASSPRDSYLYMSLANKLYSVNDVLAVTYNTVNGPTAGFIYYMVLSRGTLIKQGSLQFGSSVKNNLQITHDMVPSFRLIGYFYNKRGEIIADSVWVDVRDECEIKVKVTQKGSSVPGKQSTLEFDLHGQRARVALLAVDKAFYALNADNRLTAKQVFSVMQSYDLGCSYGGGSNPESVIGDAGLSFISQSQSKGRTEFRCGSQSARQRRAVDLQLEMMTLKSNFSNEKLQDCCGHGFSRIPMNLTCQEREKRVSLVQKSQECADAFLKCCLEGERLRHKKIQEDAQKGFGRTASEADIEEFFLDTAQQYIRRFFPPSFAFTEFNVDGKHRYSLTLPDSITTWEIQVIALSAASGFCVVQPTEIKAFKTMFVSLRLPYSVKRYEQMSISPVIYNYGDDSLQVAVHMEQAEGLCSPGSATTTAFVNITVEPHSSQFVSFSAVPMVTGSIPITIRLYDIENEMGVDAIQKTLNVWTEGLEQRLEETQVIKLDGLSTKTLFIDGTLPDEVMPDSSSNLFISAEENGFHIQVKNLLNPERVAGLIVLPQGCLEQTTVRLAPTASALRYLDLSEQWLHLPAGARDKALDNIIKGYTRIFDHRSRDGSYAAWSSVPSSNWLTALIVKILSLVGQRQTAALGLQGRITGVVPAAEIERSVRYLLSVQKTDGSFIDPHPVLHRNVLAGKDHAASMTAFITLSLRLSLEFLHSEARNNVEASISRSTTYLMSNVRELQHPYAVAITAYCLAVCLPEGTDLSTIWTKLEAMATEGKDGCYLWTKDASTRNQKKADAITVETTAYALLTAVALEKTQVADKAACWLVTQENYFGGYKSSQDTIMALEALAEYQLKRPVSSDTNLLAEFTVPGKNDIVKLVLVNQEKVETSLKKLSGNNIVMQLSGKGEIKLKIVKAFHILDPKDDCAELSISVTVEGKVKYTAKVIETYEYYDDFDNIEEKEPSVPQSAIDRSDDRTRSRRDVDTTGNSNNVVTYTVCVSQSVNNSLTGMAIADITLLSGFEVETEDLEKLTRLPEQYISHYEVSYGRVLIYFNEFFEKKECISFDAIQRVLIGLLQPAPAVFYDYYEPSRKCTVFYSAPKRSKLVSKLCSEDVCQCAERPCHKQKMTFSSESSGALTKNDRFEHACFHPTVDYAYIVDVVDVSMRSNFQMYSSTITQVLRSNGDMHVKENSVRVFAKRRQCKVELIPGSMYLIMGKDGSTTDSNGEMQYLLESNTWVEKKPSDRECEKSANRAACRGFSTFVNEYKLDGCKQ